MPADSHSTASNFVAILRIEWLDGTVRAAVPQKRTVWSGISDRRLLEEPGAKNILKRGVGRRLHESWPSAGRKSIRHPNSNRRPPQQNTQNRKSMSEIHIIQISLGSELR